MPEVVTQPVRPRADRLAIAITDITSPGLVVLATLVAVTWHSASSAAEAGRTIALSVAFAAGVPYAYLAWRLRRAPTLDRHVRRRSDRLLVFLVGLVSTAVGTACLIWLDAPRDVVALVVAMVAGLVVMSVLTRRWLVSMHVSTAAGAATVVAVVYGPTSVIALFPVLAAIGWARERLHHHTRLELLVGALVGAGVAGTVFPLLR
jgi:membrane-associated phospholipid phosphatase